MLHRTLRIVFLATALAAPLFIANCARISTGNINIARDENGIVSTGNTNTQRQSPPNGEKEVSDLLDQYNDALLKKDAAVLDRIWADDLSFVNLRGQLLNKKERMENIKTGATSLDVAKVSDKQVRVYGDTAVATLVVNIEGQYSGKEGDGSFRVTTVWAKPKGTWQMVATQMTPIVK
jgi:uncharacterized protein (TIGR02246 family)